MCSADGGAPSRVVGSELVTPAGVAQSGADAPEPGEARLLASGALVQQAAQASGLVALLVVVTVLARRLSVAELGAYGLVASLAGYLLVLRNSVAAAAVRAMAGATVTADRARTFAAAAALYVRVGLVTGLLIAVAALAIAALVLDGTAGGGRADRRRRASARSPPSGIAASVYLDGLRAERLLVRAALTEMAGVALWLASDARADPVGRRASARVIAASGAMPLLSGLLSLVAVRRAAAAVPAAGGSGAGARDRAHRRLAARGRAVEPCELRLPARDPRRLPLARPQVGLYEGPLRAHNLLYALNGALAVPTVPTASRYVATGGRAPAARAGAARQPLHARAVRARLRDADGAGRAAAARLARRPLRRGRHRADDPRLLLAPLRGARGHARASSWARAGRARWRS